MAKVPRVVCLIGPESTGKTELAKALGYPWTPEFARDYAEKKNGRLTYADVEPIAHGQMDVEALGPGPEALVIKDTDLVSTVVYSRFYYGRCPDWIVDEARKRKADLYLLMDTDVPWKADAARDAGGDAREDLFDRFRATLDEFDCNWTIISGDWQSRFDEAVAAIEGLGPRA